MGKGGRTSSRVMSETNTKLMSLSARKHGGVFLNGGTIG